MIQPLGMPYVTWISLFLAAHGTGARSPFRFSRQLHLNRNLYCHRIDCLLLMILTARHIGQGLITPLLLEYGLREPRLLRGRPIHRRLLFSSLTCSIPGRRSTAEAPRRGMRQPFNASPGVECISRLGTLRGALGEGIRREQSTIFVRPASFREVLPSPRHQANYCHPGEKKKGGG